MAWRFFSFVLVLPSYPILFPTTVVCIPVHAFTISAVVALYLIHTEHERPLAGSFYVNFSQATSLTYQIAIDIKYAVPSISNVRYLCDLEQTARERKIGVASLL